jgi:thiamine-monophosphate kinase
LGKAFSNNRRPVVTGSRPFNPRIKPGEGMTAQGSVNVIEKCSSVVRPWKDQALRALMSRHDGEESESIAADTSEEDRLIATYFRPIATHPGAFGLADDAAAIAPPPGCDLVLTADGVISGVHFFPEDPADAVARKALRINLSDLAAKGAAPLGFLLSIGLPAGLPDDWLKCFARGLRQDAEHYGCPLLGGDTDRSPGAITVYIAALGTVPHGGMVRRKGARPGDVVVVTGAVGDAALGLLVRQDATAAGRWRLDAAMRDHLLGRYLLPQPRTAVAQALRRHASAAIDVSDGLVGDLAKLCRVSGVGADAAIADVPLSQAARQVVAAAPALIETILTGGDDFEVIATVAPDRLAALREEAAAADVTVTRIGTVRAGEGAHFRDADGRALAFRRPSYSHF